MPPEGATLLDPVFMRRLEMLQVLSKKAQASLHQGEHASLRRGRSVEFADYRNYVAGDDFRYIDWNVFGRLEKLFLKLFAEEEELSLYCLLDCSASMGFGTPSKLDYARQVAAALTYIALCNYDRAAIGGMRDRLASFMPAARGKGQASRVFHHLQGFEAEGTTDIGAACEDFARKKQRPGIAVLVSDFLQEADWWSGIKTLLGRRFEVFLVQVLDAEEVEPTLRGDLRLVDSETGAVREVTISERIRHAYRQTLRDHLEKLEATCRRYGVGYIQARTQQPFEDLILEYLRLARLLK